MKSKAQEIIEVLADTIRRSRRIHTVWREQEELHKRLKGHKLTSLVGKWQYFYTKNEGCVSLIKISIPSVSSYLKFNTPKLKDRWVWECYTLKGNYFEDIKRFKNKKEAEEFIYNIMGDNL